VQHAAGLSVIGAVESRTGSGGLVEFIENVIGAPCVLRATVRTDLASRAAAGALVERVVGALWATAMLGGFDERMAKLG
jgi:hypothetical protein